MNTSPKYHVDMGTQYLSPNPARAHPILYEELEEAGVIVPLPQVCLSALVKVHACMYVLISVCVA